MGWLYLVSDRTEIERRRRLLLPREPVEAWPDLSLAAEPPSGDAPPTWPDAPDTQAPVSSLAWIGEDAKRTLDGAGDPLPVVLAVPEEAVPIYYGPRLTGVESLPTEASLRARVLSAGGIGVVWMTYDPTGRRTDYQPVSRLDPTFYLRRPRGTLAHVWRLFRTRPDARAHGARWQADDPEATGWAEGLPCEDFGDLTRRFARRPGPGGTECP